MALIVKNMHDNFYVVTGGPGAGKTTLLQALSRYNVLCVPEAARQITFVTQQQRSGTEQVSQSVKSIADVVTQAVSATSQTRASAEALKQQADRLSQLVRAFELARAEAAE